MAEKKSDKENYDKMPDFDDIDNMIEIENVDDDDDEYGPNMKPPSYHELRVPILKREVAYTNGLLSDHKESWKKYGCSIMSDGWTSKTNRTLVNFLVNCPSGTMFVKSIDASSFMKTGEKTFELLDAFVEQIVEANVVQVVSNDGSNYVLAGKLLEAKSPNLYWTPCAAHCIDLILEDIGKIPRIAKTLERAIQLTGYIYNHGGVLNMMREYTKQRELVRAGKTRFCTSYLTIKSIYKQKHNLRAMFTSEESVHSRWAKEANAK
ncbi:hypothetical protein SO802_026646 [Lithocarpus litseifolius]|uniref:DUF659 domain-containing protein n=1 Tax=Lithocarpus litseifolius TaxID=425828 RepID=A0AAW2C1Z4_9ROSI